MNILQKTSVLVMFVMGTAAFSAPAEERLSAQQLAELRLASQLQSNDKFDAFLLQIQKSPVLSQQTSVMQAINQFLIKQSLSPQQQQHIQRLLGLYTRIKYGNDAMQTLAELVAIPTFRVEGLAQHQNPEFHKMAEAIAHIAQRFQLNFRNIDNRVFEVSIEGSGDEVVGIHAHADVVPVTPALWVLEDGTQLNPFKLTRINDKMYGRGTEDDKNGIVVTLYAMKVIKEENIPLLRNFHLLIDTTEETSSEAIPYYFARNPTPNYNLALDGGYPVVIAEKGSGAVISSFAVRTAEHNNNADAEIISVTGGLAVNQIPSASTAIIKSTNPNALIDRLNALAKTFVANNGDDFTISASVSQGAIKLIVKGVSAHSSEPESGINPVSRMFTFIQFVQQQDNLFMFNHITDAATYIADNWGLDSYGKRLNIDFSHDFMGPLTSAVTLVALDDKNLKVAVNLRIPVGRRIDEIKQDIAQKLDNWQTSKQIEVSLNTRLSEPMFRNPEGAWVNALLDVASENLSMPREFVSSNGGTSVHNLPNGVQFGLAMPDEKYTGHNANEFKRVDQFLLDLQIITEMIARIGQIPHLQ